MSRSFIDTNVFLYAFLNQDDGQMYGSVKAVNPFKNL